jgi:hypothetical protein
MEAGGSPVFPYFPLLPLIWSQTPVESPQLSLSSKRWFDMAPTISTVKASDNKHHFGAQYIPLVVTVYASCQHLCSLCKTRFRWLTIPCRDRIGYLQRNFEMFHFYYLIDKSSSHGLITARRYSVFLVRYSKDRTPNKE